MNSFIPNGAFYIELDPDSALCNLNEDMHATTNDNIKTMTCYFWR